MKKRTTLTILFVMAMLAASCGSDAPDVSERSSVNFHMQKHVDFRNTLSCQRDS